MHYSHTEAIHGLELFLVLLPFPALLYPPEVWDQHCTHPTRAQSPGDLLHTTVGFFNNIILIKTLNSYLTFLTLAECSDDISLFARMTPWEWLIWGLCMFRLLFYFFFHVQSFSLFNIKRRLSLFLLTSCRVGRISFSRFFLVSSQ